MTIRTIDYLLNRFGSGKSPGSADYVDLIDTLADDRNAVYFSATAPADTEANPLWFNTSTNVLSVYSNAVWSNIDLSLKAPLASPTLTGTPTAPTATAGTNTTQIATTEFVGTAVSNLVDAAPAALDTLNELAAALGDDANFASTVTTSLSDKASLTSANTFTTSPQQINGAASAVGLIVKANATTPGDLQQWQDSTNTILAKISASGEVRSPLFGSTSTGKALLYTAASATGEFRIDTNVAANKGLVVRGAPSQTANLQEWQNSSGTVLNRINSSGHLIASSRSVFGGATSIVSGMIVAAVSQEAAAVPILAKGSASQTADLQQWQDSAGIVLAKVDSAGYIWSPDQDVASQTSWTGAVTLSQTDSLKTYIKKQLTGNTTVTVSDGVAGKTYSCTLELQQDATGSRSIILKGCRTAYGVALVLTTTASAIDIVRLEWNGTSWTAFMGAAQISVPSAWV